MNRGKETERNEKKKEKTRLHEKVWLKSYAAEALAIE